MPRVAPQYFFDRIARGRPICIPGSGVQMTVVAHAEDLATMLAAAVGNPAADGQIFNAVGDRGISLDGMAKLCAKVAGAEAQIVHYDPKGVEGVDVKKAFPFRPVHFYAEPRAAKRLLGWCARGAFGCCAALMLTRRMQVAQVDAGGGAGGALGVLREERPRCARAAALALRCRAALLMTVCARAGKKEKAFPDDDAILAAVGKK